MKLIAVQEAVGMVLAHDVTRIVPGLTKGPAFKKGHIVGERDVPALLDMGKAHLYVLEMAPGMVHEDEAARRIAQAAAGPGLELTEPSEGRVNLVAQHDGLLKVDPRGLEELNSLGDIAFATLHGNHRVQRGQAVGGTRIIPLVTGELRVRQAEKICFLHHNLIEVRPFRPFRVGLVVTGSEIYHGRIADAFGPVVEKKFNDLGSQVVERFLVSDDQEMTLAAIAQCQAAGVDLIALTGGMSVDPDDLTPASIRAAGARVVSHGAPTFPGAMFMLAYLDQIPVVGLPGCVMYHETSIFELIIPRLLTGEELQPADLAKLGHGGFCAGCQPCRYPLCGFGKV